jgi:hypothetical protein
MTIYAHWLPKTKTNAIAKMATSIFSKRHAEPVEADVVHHKSTSSENEIVIEGKKAVNA